MNISEQAEIVRKYSAQHSCSIVESFIDFIQDDEQPEKIDEELARALDIHEDAKVKATMKKVHGYFSDCCKASYKIETFSAQNHEDETYEEGEYICCQCNEPCQLETK